METEEWCNFSHVIEKEKTATHNVGQEIGDHFVDVNKMIELPKGATQENKEKLEVT